MKVKSDFVTNSSSSSFVIRLRDLHGAQLHAILENDQSDQAHGDPYWLKEVRYGYLLGYTSMDNYDYEEFFKKIGVNSENVHWGDGYEGGAMSNLRQIMENDKKLNKGAELVKCPKCGNIFDHYSILLESGEDESL